MAQIVAGVGCSHVPAIGAAIDLGKTNDDYWKPLFAGFERYKQIMAELKPDLVIEVYNDHGSAFSLQYIPTFSLGVAPEFQPADEGWGPRRVPMVKGDPELAWHLV
ncbi:MAG: protocatechuate 3,4-dioxygenase, partial [Acidobacteriia bacterium]|nr:protocatechuate 3,4-dioxygenase [Terriglobia bacterium]